MIKFSFSTDELSNLSVDLYALIFSSNFSKEDSSIISLQKYVQNISLVIEKQEFSGKAKQANIFLGNAADKIHYIGLYGLGNFNDTSNSEIKELIRVAGANTIRHSEKYKIGLIGVSLPAHSSLSKADIAYEFTIGALLAHYHFDEFITNPNKKLKQDAVITFSVSSEEKKIVEESVVKAYVVAQSVNQARYWGDQTPSLLYPCSFSNQVKTLLEGKKNLSIKILEKKECEKLNMGGILGVAKGSIHEPQMVIVEYEPKKRSHVTVAIVGKGVTFDTGGISIKPSDGMEDMKDDMAGAAAVLSTMLAISELKPNINIIACAPMVENMPSGSALKPGDIVTFYNKKTAEIKNTDAEGRLILADALCYVTDTYKPDFIIDLATLTGACVVALGKFFAGLMTKDDAFAKELIEASLESGDRAWRLPFHDDYKKAIESEVADICNIGKGNYKAGTITAGFFLSNFVSDKTRWIHLDIAGVAMSVPDKPYFRNYGATGSGVRLLIEFLTNSNYLEKLKPSKKTEE